MYWWSGNREILENWPKNFCPLMSILEIPQSSMVWRIQLDLPNKL